MRIQRFNETISPYESHTDFTLNTDFFENSKLEEFFDAEATFYETKGKILDLINEYIDLNHEYFLDEYELKPGDVINFTVKEVNTPPFNRMALKLEANNNFNILRTVDFKKLVEFTNNPEAYKNSKKFNI